LLQSAAVLPMQAENERSFKLLQVSSLQCWQYTTDAELMH
jgi:hypothetical protein